MMQLNIYDMVWWRIKGNQYIKLEILFVYVYICTY